MFEEKAAAPFWSMVETFASTSPQACCFENVQGLEIRALEVDGERMSCLDYIMQVLRAKSEQHLFAVVPPRLTTPTAAGGYIARPREYILCGRRDKYPFATSDEFEAAVRELVCQVNGKLRDGRAARAPSFAIGLPRGRASSGSFVPCGCTVNVSCELHPCKCRHCRGSATGRGLTRTRRRGGSLVCQWRRRHQAAWTKLGGQRPDSYFRMMFEEQGIDAGHDLLSPRERDLVELAVAEHVVAHGTFPENGVLDKSQSHGWHQWRADGCLPTLATSSDLYCTGLGRALTAEEGFLFMGFPEVHDHASFSARDRKRLLGNTMHVGSVGIMLSVLLGLRDQAPARV